MLLPLGAQCVNQAVKAIAIARRDLADADASDGPTFLSCFPDFRGDDRRSVSMQCDKETKAPWSTSDADLTVAAAPNAAAAPPAAAVAQPTKVESPAAGAARGRRCAPIIAAIVAIIAAVSTASIHLSRPAVAAPAAALLHPSIHLVALSAAAKAAFPAFHRRFRRRSRRSPHLNDRLCI